MVDETTNVTQAQDEVALDDLFSQGVDHAQVGKTQADSLLASGNYHTVPPLTLNASRVKEGPNEGRPMFRFFGRLIGTKLGTESENQAKGATGWGISPVRVDQKDKPGTPDLATKLWAQAVSAYTVAAGQKPQTNRDVVEFIRDYAVSVRLIQMGVPTERNPEPTGEPGNLVVSISAIRS